MEFKICAWNGCGRLSASEGPTDVERPIGVESQSTVKSVSIAESTSIAECANEIGIEWETAISIEGVTLIGIEEETLIGVEIGMILKNAPQKLIYILKARITERTIVSKKTDNIKSQICGVNMKKMTVDAEESLNDAILSETNIWKVSSGGTVLLLMVAAGQEAEQEEGSREYTLTVLRQKLLAGEQAIDCGTGC